MSGEVLEKSCLESVMREIEMWELLDIERTLDLANLKGQRENQTYKKKRGRPSRDEDRKTTNLRSFEVDGKVYVWFGNKCVEKDSELYRAKRIQSCEAVKRYRMKNGHDTLNVDLAIEKLAQENRMISDKLEKLSIEIGLLKQRVNEYIYKQGSFIDSK